MKVDLAFALHTPKIRRVATALTAKDADAYTHVAIMAGNDLRELPFGETLETRMRRVGYEPAEAKPFIADLPNRRGTRLGVATLAPTMASFERLTLARKLIGPLLADSPERLVLAVVGLEGETAFHAAEALLAAALAGAFTPPRFKSSPDKARALKEIVLYGAVNDALLQRAVAAARGNNLARHLTALPPNELTPGTYRRHIEQLAKAKKWSSEFLDLKQLRRLGAGAFVAVAQGSPNEDAGILRLRYTPRKRSNAAPLALVGKGICFDTGGTNLKSAKHMQGMHEDMQGSAVALGVLLALTELDARFPIDCWLAIAENHIGPKAYRQNEVVRAANGTTIEIVHTDAEGRMVLADTLHLAGRAKPRVLIDYATLTGSCIGALGTRMSGALTNRREWLMPLIDAGEASGERVWPFPLAEDYAELLKSDVADIKQCTIENEADHILAAVFLNRFVPKETTWVHLDLAAGNNKSGLAHVPSDTTGFGVRFTLELLAAQGLT